MPDPKPRTFGEFKLKDGKGRAIRATGWAVQAEKCDDFKPRKNNGIDPTWDAEDGELKAESDA